MTIHFKNPTKKPSLKHYLKINSMADQCTCTWLNKHERRHKPGCPVHLPAIPMAALKDFYALHTLVSKIDSNYLNDVNNPNMSDKQIVLVDEAKAICQKWIDGNPPIN
jgi:hypothetical protein